MPLVPDLLPKVVPHRGSRLLPHLIVRLGRRLVAGAPSIVRPQARPPGCAGRQRDHHPGDPRPVAPLPQRARLLAFRPSAPARVLPEPVLPEPVQPAGTGPGARDALAAACLRPRGRAEPSAVYRVLDTTLVPAVVRVRACRKGLFAGQATLGRSASKTEWVYGFKVAALVVDPKGVVSAFGLAPAASSDERPTGEARSWPRIGTRPTWPTQGLLRGRLGETLVGALRGPGGGHPEEQRPPQGMAEGGPPLGVGQAPDHRGGDRPAQGLLRPRTPPPGQDPPGAAHAPGRQGGGIHLRATAERPARSTAAPPGGPVDLAHCTSAV